MVGVGGRSKGCKTCRRRKVKCDEEKPTCSRCRKANIKCEGYVQFAEFIHVNDRDAGKPLVKRRASKPAQAPSSVSDASEASAASSNSEYCMELSLQNFCLIEPLYVNPAWDQQSMFTSHLIQRMFSWSNNPSSPFSAAWVQVLLRDSKESPVLSHASIQALSTSFFGKVHGDRQIMQQGAAHYFRALRALQVDLQDPNRVTDDATLMAVLIMAIYELVASEHPSGWLNHYKGLARLVLLRGPEAHQTGVGFNVFSTLRSCLAIGYIIERKHLFLENIEWKTIPWAIQGLDSKVPLQELHDYMVDVPGILEDMDTLVAWPPGVPGRSEFKDQAAQRALELLNLLYAWHWEWIRKFPSATFTISTAGLDPETAMPIPPSPFESILWFNDSYRGTELITYNALRLILMICLELTGILTPGIPSAIGVNDPLLPMQGTRHDIAVEICRMADYHLHSFRRSLGAFIILFPLNVALVHLDENATEIKRWLRQKMARVADSYGFEVGRDDVNPKVHQTPLLVKVKALLADSSH
ncbi:hypothetical protein N7468_000225 [Penicillium chermesinum]|uniref:Zn(2)-C6 fungal-type domain-containing protein n=1 Tax=Penicillium chermesinum TaxID=63820 RepID=A0A9W9PL74_9EURO|nr:uncharacterized protein N7468_000225 [Penicillium chermesinum]KAJ5248774.1 hypothetical protein N7468_000225 [Penicillium chermesinum]KAJ6150878.1 hypothetical protein N7470_007472 [Penicillium chermesinum]